MKFCTGCQSMRDEAGGMVKRSNRTARWMCRGCAERKTASIYQSKGQGTAKDAERIRRLIGAANR